MPYQPNLFSPEPDQPNSTPAAPVSAPDAAPPRRPHDRARQQYTRWLQRTELLVRVIVRLYLGLLIIALPWMRFWTENGLFSYLPAGDFLANSGFLRGLVSGLGVLNVAMAFQELFFPSHRR
jgi:hypothetical protein